MVANNRGVVTRMLGSRSRKLSPALAEEVLAWQFNQAEKKRVAQLLDKNNRGTISRAEMDELETLVALGGLLDVLHAKARLSLKSRRPQRAA